MELNIIKLLKQLRRILHKPMPILEKPKPAKQPKPIKAKREQIKTVVDGRKLSLSQIAMLYKLEPHTVYARYRVGNRGKLLTRPSHRKPA